MSTDSSGVLSAPSYSSSDSPKADMIYGPSGSGKTTQIGRAARFIFKKTAKLYGKGKITRLVTADPGGYKTIDPYVNLGVVQAFSLLDERVIAPLSAISKLTQGYWPFHPETGEPLLRVIKDGNGKDLPKDHPFYGRQFFDFTHQLAKPTVETWKKVGGLAFEGLHSITTFIQNYLSAHPEILGELAGATVKKDGALSQIRDGGETYVQPGQASYGFVQKRAFDLVRQSCDLPVEKVIWTSLEKLYEVKDKDGNVIETEHWYPSLIGSAALRGTPQWFGMLCHLDVVQTGVVKDDRTDLKPGTAAAMIGTTTTEIRAYLRDHVNPRDKRIFKAKPRVALETVDKMPLIYKFTPSGDGLDTIYEKEDECQAGATDIVARDLGITGKVA